MIQLSVPYWSLLVVSAVLTAIVCILAFRTPARQGAIALGFLMFSLTFWSVFYAAELNGAGLARILFWARIEYIGIVTLPPLWLIFSLSLNPWEKFKRLRFTLSLFLIPAIILFFCWTNEWHHLFWVKNDLIVIDGRSVMKNIYGPVFWMHFVYSYLLIAAGTALLVYRFLVTDAIHRYRFVYVLSPILPVLANVAQFVNLNPFGYLDMTPFAFSITGLMLLWGATRNFTLDLVPSAREIVMEKQLALALQESKERYEGIFVGMRDALLVESMTGRILDANQAACRIYGWTHEEMLMKTASDLAGDHPTLFVNSDERLNGVHPDLRETVLQTLNQRFNGEVFPVEISGSILNLASENVLLVIVRDITDKVKAEATIRSREQYLQLLNKITWDALAGNSLHDTLQALVERVAELFDASSAFINLWDEQTHLIRPGAACGSMKEIYPKLNALPVENTLAKDALDTLQPIVVEDIYHTPYQSPEISLLFPARTVMALPLMAGSQKLGCALITFDDIHHFTEEALRWGMQAADQIALSISRSYLMQKTQELLSETQRTNETLELRISERTTELKNAYVATIECWARVLELREKETAGHSQRTMEMSIRFATRLHVDGEHLEHIRRGALLHDIGKMVISDAILQKPGALNASERKIIEEHPIYSRKILEPIAYLRQATDIPYYHHERWDGTGYPQGLAGEAIPRDARMFAIVDVWDALSSSRYYRAALPKDTVIEHIVKGIGTHFDPVMAKVFLQMIQEDPDE